MCLEKVWARRRVRSFRYNYRSSVKISEGLFSHGIHSCLVQKPIHNYWCEWVVPLEELLCFQMEITLLIFLR